MYANGNVGLNCNQNHSQGGRISTRVLAPPGGGSSFSIGGYGGGPDYSSQTNSRRHSQNNYDKYQDMKKGCESGYGEYSNRHQQPQTNYGYEARRNSFNNPSNGHRNQSRHQDENVDVGNVRRQSMGGGPMSKNSYAEILRQQIIAKKGYDSGAKIGSNPYNSDRSQRMKHNAHYGSGYNDSNDMVVVDRRRGCLPAAARTTFSLNWD